MARAKRSAPKKTSAFVLPPPFMGEVSSGVREASDRGQRGDEMAERMRDSGPTPSASGRFAALCGHLPRKRGRKERRAPRALRTILLHRQCAHGGAGVD